MRWKTYQRLRQQYNEVLVPIVEVYPINMVSRIQIHKADDRSGLSN